MIETVMGFFAAAPAWLAAISLIVAGLSAVTALTPSTSDDAIVQKVFLTVSQIYLIGPKIDRRVEMKLRLQCTKKMKLFVVWLVLLSLSVSVIGCSRVNVTRSDCLWAYKAPELSPEDIEHIVSSNISPTTIEAINTLDNFVWTHNELVERFCLP